MPNGFPPGTSGRIVFFGAPQDPMRPGFPDLSMEVGPVTDITALAGLQYMYRGLAWLQHEATPATTAPRDESRDRRRA